MTPFSPCVDLLPREEFHETHSVEPTDFGGEYCTLCGASSGPVTRQPCPLVVVA